MSVNCGLVSILLSSYMGEKYIGDQIASIQAQSYSNWRLIVRDDGSSDSTLDIARQYSSADGRIEIVTDGFGNLGPAGSFIRLLGYVDSPYFMFCDQDDVWLPNKVADCIAAIEDGDVPHLVFTDLAIVDEHLHETAPSFMKLARFDPIAGTTFSKLLIQNVVVGCTIAGNRSLLDTSRLNAANPPRNILMHDWWLALVACAFGKITYLDQNTILYRQHGRNCLGAQKSGLNHYLRLLRHQRPWLKAQRYLNMVTAQAKSFAEYYGPDLNFQQQELLKRLLRVRSGFVLPALLGCFKAGISMHTFNRNLALFLSFVGGKNKAFWIAERLPR